MVLGLRSKNRKGTSVQVDYVVNVQEIKPWPPSQSLRSVQAVLLQWENGDQNSGTLSSAVGDGKIELHESFALPVTLCREKRTRDNFQKNCLEFYLYESRKDKVAKGQLLGTAIINLADYGIIKENLTINALVNCKKSSRNAAQPVLYVNVQPFDKESSNPSPDGSLSKEASLDKNGVEFVSKLMNEENDDESEFASFTDVDVSSHSSQTISSSAFAASKDSLSQIKEVAVGDGKTQECAQQLVRGNVVDKLPAIVASSDAYLQKGVNFAVASSRHSQAIEDDNRQVARQTKSFQPVTTTANVVHVGLLDGREKEEEQEHGQDKPVQEEKRESMENILGVKSSRDATRKQNTLRSESLAFSRRVHEVQGSTAANYKLKHLKSVQLPFVSDKVSEFSGESQNTEKINDFVNLERSHNKEKAKEIDNLEHADNNAMGNAATKEKKPSNGFSGESQNTDKAKDFDNLDQSRNTKKAEEIDNLDHAHNNAIVNAETEENKPSNGFSDSKFEWKSRIEMLEEELREAAVVESALYSVVAEHGSSTNKVHAPARRLSRFYLHACKAESDAKRASAARAAVSGLILVSKSCGSDVPRLTFWLSNSIMLRGIVNQVVEKTPLPEGPNMKTNGNGKGSGGRYSLERKRLSSTEKEMNQLIQELDNWENPKIFSVALEKVEAWIFSRIVESVWWQTLTPRMQSTAAKSSGIGSSSRRSKNVLGDQEQGSFSMELWKKAFKDACERLCPIRAGGHECGCLPLLARLVMEQLVDRLDVAMFNAVLRESAEEMPTDPVSDPISEPKVLPILAGKSSFGAGAQLKNAIGNWSRWLTDLFGIEDNDFPEDENNRDDNNGAESEKSFKPFGLLNALSDLMMLPIEMLADNSTRKEICPMFGAPLIKRVLNNFVPDEFSPDPIPAPVFEALDAEDAEEATGDLISFPCMAASTVYPPPPAASLAGFIGEVGSQTLQRSASSVLRKSYTSDDELNELDSPMTSIIIDNSRVFSSIRSSWMPKGGRNVVRYQLLREVWREGE